MSIELKKVSKIYNQKQRNEYVALNEVTFQIHDGEMVAIMGKSGAGKSTLLHIIGLLDDATYGELFIDEEKISEITKQRKCEIRRDKIGFVLQDFGLIPEDSVMDNVCLPLMFGSASLTEIKHRALEQLRRVSMHERATEKVFVLSGGEKQRVAIARAMISDPDYILADEPTGALDSKNAQEFMDELKKLNSMGKTIVIVTHDKEIARQCSRILSIADGCVIEFV